jgi:hypothetical protein
MAGSAVPEPIGSFHAGIEGVQGVPETGPMLFQEGAGPWLVLHVDSLACLLGREILGREKDGQTKKDDDAPDEWA